MEKDEIYVGMRVVYCGTLSRFEDEIGTIIDSGVAGYDCLVEFDNNVDGHDGLGWSAVSGKYGHCYWFDAADFEQIIDVAETSIEAVDIGYDVLFN